MKDFMLVYRNDFSKILQRTAKEQEDMSKRWMEWMGTIAGQNKLVERGNRLHASGKVLKGDSVVTDGPYAEIKEAIGGFSIIKADSYENAVELAKGCPVLAVGGSVEIREINAL